MVDSASLASYYSKARPFYHRFLKEVFSQGDITKLEEAARKGQVVTQDQIPLDSMLLFDARNFLRLSIFNLLAYKFLACGRYLAWSKVTLYYSYFYAVSCLLRLAGHAIIHATDPDGKIFTLQLVRQHGSHNYKIMSMKGNEHKVVWSNFATLYPNLSTQLTGKLTIEDRVRWNYDLLFPSQATEEHAVREVIVYCENNFLDPNLGQFSDPDAAEYFHELVANFGYEEIYAGDLIKEALRIFVTIARSSKYRADYTAFAESLTRDVDYFESKKETKDEVNKWLRLAAVDIGK